MTPSEPADPARKGSRLPGMLVLLALAAGGAYYLGTTEYAPSWLKEYMPGRVSVAPSLPADAETVGGSAVSSPARTAPETPAIPMPPFPAQPQKSPQQAEGSGQSPAGAPSSGAAVTLPGEAGTGEGAATDAETSPGALAGTADGTGANAGSSHPAEGAQGARQAETPGRTAAPGVPVIAYSKARPTTPQGNVAAGVINPETPPVDTRELYGTRESRLGLKGRATPKGEDSVVGLSFINDFALFLASNYWPAGTHPQARGRAITTASLKWLNTRYGSGLQGLHSAAAAPAEARRQILDYALMPSMVNGLYRLYSERFISALNREAEARTVTRDGGEQHLSASDKAGMFQLYAAKARGLSGVLRSYADTPDIRGRIDDYLASEDAVSEARLRYLEVENAAPAKSAGRAAAYQKAVVRREQARDHIAAALRRGGNTQGVDTDSLVFAALWLHRRDAKATSALPALSAVLAECADRMEEERERILLPPAARRGNGDPVLPAQGEDNAHSRIPYAR